MALSILTHYLPIMCLTKTYNPLIFCKKHKLNGLTYKDIFIFFIFVPNSALLL